MTFTTIEVYSDRAAGIVVLNRPGKHNAVSMQMMGEIAAALDAYEADETVRGVIITGSDIAFSTGADLDEALTIISPIDTLEYNRAWRSLTYRIEHLRKPVIAAISGHCITGGLELALCCDIRLAAENAKFAITSAKIGSVAGAGGTQRLPRVVGPSTAKELLFTARFIDAPEALQIGLVNQVVPTGHVVAAAQDMVDTFAARGPLSIAWMKTAVNTGLGMDLESALELEASLSAQAFATEDKAEGMHAFLEKRNAKFQGR